MTLVEEIEIGQIGEGESMPIGRLQVVDKEVEITPAGDRPLSVGYAAVTPEEVPFVGVADRAPAPPHVSTAEDLLLVFHALGQCLPVASLDDDRITECLDILESMGLVIHDGGYVCSYEAVSALRAQLPRI
jgi:hypothetical protein